MTIEFDSFSFINKFSAAKRPADAPYNLDNVNEIPLQTFSNEWVHFGNY